MRVERRIKLQVYLILILYCFIFACGDDPEEKKPSLNPEEEIMLGWEEYNSGRYGSAMQAYERAIKAISDNNSLLAEAYNGLGWVYLGFSGSNGLNYNYIARSLDKFQEAISLDSNNADAYVGKACLLFIRRSSKDDFNESINCIDKALEADKAYLYRHNYDSISDLYALKAQCYYYMGESEKARAEAEKVLAIEENNITILTIKRLLAD